MRIVIVMEAIVTFVLAARVAISVTSVIQELAIEFGRE